MEIEALNQCLEYIQLTSKKSEIEKFIPLIGALSGALFGTTITLLAASRKERRAEKNKLICCNEDVAKIQMSIEKFMRQLMPMMEAAALKNKLVKHSFPDNINSLCLANYFTDVAHKYNKEQRNWVQVIINNVEVMNASLKKLTKPSEAGTPFQFSLLLLNSASTAMRTWKLCQSVIDKKKFDMNVEELVLKIGLSEDQISYRNLLALNAENDNNTLGL